MDLTRRRSISQYKPQKSPLKDIRPTAQFRSKIIQSLNPNLHIYLQKYLCKVSAQNIDQIFQQQIEKYRLKYKQKQVEPKPALFSTCQPTQDMSILNFIYFQQSELKKLLPYKQRELNKNISGKLVVQKHYPQACLVLSKLYLYEGNNEQALKWIKLTKVLNSDLQTFSNWLFAIRIANNFDCSKTIRTIEKSVETLLLQIKYKYSKQLVQQLFELDQYHAILVWGHHKLYSENQHQQYKGINLLGYLLENYPYEPYAYFVLWNYYYTKKQYAKALVISHRGFLRINSTKGHQILIGICIARCFNRLNDYFSALQILYHLYMKNPQYTLLLYYYGKYALKTYSKYFLIGALSALKQVPPEEKNNTLYWLVIAYQKAGYTYKALSYYARYQQIFTSKQQTFLQTCLNQNSKHLELVKNYQKGVFNTEGFDYTDEIFLFVVAKMNWRHHRQNEAFEYLNRLIQDFPYKPYYSFTYIKYQLAMKHRTHSIQFVNSMINQISQSDTPIHDYLKAHFLYAKMMATKGNTAGALEKMSSLNRFFLIKVELQQDPEDHQYNTFLKTLTLNSVQKFAVTAFNPRESLRLSSLRQNHITNLSGYFFNFSDPSFLYYIAKYALNDKRLFTAGLKAVNSYIEIISPGEVPPSRILCKALYVKALILVQMLHPDGLAILREIVDQLEEFGFESKAQEARELIPN